eukprot:SAG11_NODE_1722_length_4374_cov_5.082807_2_plen_111_part_00
MTRDIAPPLVGANDFIEEAISSEYCASVFVIVGKQDVKVRAGPSFPVPRDWDVCRFGCNWLFPRSMLLPQNFEQKMFSGLSSYCTYPTDPMTGRIRCAQRLFTGDCHLAS